MMRGQAFSTFKLMIAAVVAVAILGILLSILGGIQNPVGFDQQAKSLLKDVSGGGSIQKGPEVSLSSGSIYDGSLGSPLSSAAGGKSVEFSCGTGFCSPQGSWDSSLEISNDGRSDMTACCSDDTCYLGIGIDTSEIKNKC